MQVMALPLERRANNKAVGDSPLGSRSPRGRLWYLLDSKHLNFSKEKGESGSPARFNHVLVVDPSRRGQEPHLLHEFEEDFYGEKLHLLLCGFIRKEQNFKSVGEATDGVLRWKTS